MQTPDDRFDVRLRGWLEPDQAAVDRVRARVFGGSPPKRRAGRRLLIAAIVGVCAVVGGILLWRSSLLDADQYTATYVGEILVVRGPDGSISISGPPDSDGIEPGTWRITLQGDR